MGDGHSLWCGAVSRNSSAVLAIVPRVDVVAVDRSSDGRARLGVQQLQDEIRDGAGIFDVAHMGAMG